jgi:hypothetical protein
MDGIYCNECGVELDEASTLLPEQRSPCPSCGSLARRFEKTLRGSFFRLPGEEPVTVERTVGHDAIVMAETAKVAVEALLVTVHGEPPPGVRVIEDHLVVAHRHVRWTQLTGKPGAVWLVEALDESGELLESGTGDNQDDALLAIIDALRPPDPK